MIRILHARSSKKKKGTKSSNNNILQWYLEPSLLCSLTRNFKRVVIELCLFTHCECHKNKMKEKNKIFKYHKRKVIKTFQLIVVMK